MSNCHSTTSETANKMKSLSVAKQFKTTVIWLTSHQSNLTRIKQYKTLLLYKKTLTKANKQKCNLEKITQEIQNIGEPIPQKHFFSLPA